ncbi:hypothetical protein H4R18_000316 [Coemansia javaensis]|uniref:Uncharacterized protein n=1 Tax=Coemansia javaensis TaxID=2761396 RepID=A0A9W8HIH3_9FUNG|nr:hypothetical protein H4R18_000316 [Coemansia javaensis]
MDSLDSCIVAAIPQYILDRGDSAREYRRKSSCNSRTSSDTSAGAPGPLGAPATDRGMGSDDPDDYSFAYAAQSSSPSDHAAWDPLDGGEATFGLTERRRRQFGVARPRLVHVQK